MAKSMSTKRAVALPDGHREISPGVVRKLLTALEDSDGQI